MSPFQDMACQDILQDESRWIQVASRTKNEWARCLQELQNFEELLEKDRLRRIRWAKYFKIVGFTLTIVQNIFAAAAALIPLSKYGTSDGLNYTLSFITFIMSLTLWSRLEKQSNKYLVLANDNVTLTKMCEHIRKVLKDIISDGKITSQERNMLRDMIGQMNRKSEEVGTMDLFMKLFGPGEHKSGFLNDQANYNDAYKGLSNIVDQITSSQKEINMKLPHVIKEFEDVQIQRQIHSLSMRPPMGPV